ncbi:MAG: chemotaxis protein CheX, partial [candidate division Zixibacteria bacterium]|nr:chemotaxis protein CheX [candidate division Zixibacteria bacterium]
NLDSKSKSPVVRIDEAGNDLDWEIVAECERAEVSLQFIQLALEHASDAVIWTKSDGYINYVNDAACKLLGYSRPKLVTKSMMEIAHGFSKTSWGAHFDMTRKQHSRIFDLKLYSSKNQAVNVNIAAHYITFKEQEYNCFLIRDLTDKYNATLEEREHSFVAQKTASLEEEIEGREKIESMLLDEVEKIQNLLDNVGQGFLTFGKDQKVDLQCSQECRVMFNGEVWGSLFPELLYPDDVIQRTFLTSLLNDIFHEEDLDMCEVLFSLLPSEVSLSDNRFIEVTYRKIYGQSDNDLKLMAILSDVTVTKKLREQVVEERKLLRMVVKAIVNNKELVEAISDYKKFCSLHIDQILGGNGAPDEKFYEIYRRIHTFKGTFNQLDLVYIVPALDALEARLSELRKDREHSDLAMIEKLLDESNLRTWLDEDIKILMDTLGKAFFNSEPALDVKSSQLTEIEEDMTSLLSPWELRQLLPKMKRLRYRSIKELLRTYPAYVEKLSNRLQKQIKPMIIEGDDISVDPELYGNFCKALVHVFRNAVDHGIESVYERQEQGKDESAQIQCCIRVNNGMLLIKISDDGAGVNVKRIKQKALARGICDSNTADSMNDTELLNLIFRDDMSTCDIPTEYSGRGVGLSSVIEELNRLHGHVEVQTKTGEGTTFIFSIPVVDSNKVLKISFEQIMETIIDCTISYMTEEMSLSIDSKCIQQMVKTDLLQLEGVISLINLKGAFSGVFSIGFDNELAHYLVRKFAIGELTESEVAEYLTDTMSEITNIVTGSTLNVLPKTSSMITIGTPTTCSTEGTSYLRFTGPEMWTTVIQTDQGKFSVSLLMSEGN